MRNYSLVIGMAVMCSVACSKEDKKSFNFGAPAVAPIVDSATPAGLKGGTSLLSEAEYLSLLDTASTEESFKSYITNYVFKKDETGKVAGPVFYRYWVDILDQSMAQTQTRIEGMEDEPERCWNQAPVSVTHTFTIGGQEVSTTGKYSCWENQGTPNSASGGFQKMAFGKDGSDYYFMTVTSDAAVFSASQGERIVIAKASADSTTAEIWFIGRSLQGGPGGSQISGVANRIVADKTTGAFAYGLTDEAVGSTNCAMYARSNGTVLNFQARTPLMGSSTQCQDVTGMEWGVGACYDAKTLAPSTGCESLVTVPSNYGAATPFRETDVTVIDEDSESITKFDFSAAGIPEFK
jgi:hypothetical protein